MADLAASNVTYTIQNKRIMGGAGGGRRVFNVKIEFGTGALTYPSGGVPLTKASLGCPNALESLILVDSNDATGILWKWDKDNNKLRGYYSAGFTPSGANSAVTVSGSIVPHTHNLIIAAGNSGTAVKAIAGKINGPSGSAITVTGITTATGAGGGVVNKGTMTLVGVSKTPTFTGAARAAAVLTELASGSYAPAAQVIYAEAIGW